MAFKRLKDLQMQLDFETTDIDWWKNEKWNFGKKCKGWTIFQIFKVEPSYLRWIMDNFQLTMVPIKTRKAIYKAVEILDNRATLASSGIHRANTIIESKQQQYNKERGGYE